MKNISNEKTCALKLVARIMEVLALRECGIKEIVQ
jgi:hypothetical protein